MQLSRQKTSDWCIPLFLIITFVFFAGLSSAKAAKPILSQLDVFVSGTDGYHTFRIPALTVTPKGTVLAFCEGRKKGRSDTGNIDLVLKRSFDSG